MYQIETRLFVQTQRNSHWQRGVSKRNEIRTGNVGFRVVTFRPNARKFKLATCVQTRGNSHWQRETRLFVQTQGNSHWQRASKRKEIRTGNVKPDFSSKREEIRTGNVRPNAKKLALASWVAVSVVSPIQVFDLILNNAPALRAG